MVSITLLKMSSFLCCDCQGEKKKDAFLLASSASAVTKTIKSYTAVHSGEKYFSNQKPTFIFLRFHKIFFDAQLMKYLVKSFKL
jgi:hypothetical protein